MFEAKNERLHVVTNDTTLLVQEKIDLIDQLRAEMNEVKTKTKALRGRMDLLASKKKATKEELASVKDQLRVANNKADKLSRLNDELRAQLRSAISERDDLGREYSALKFKLEATSINSSEVEYKIDVEIAKARLRTKTKYVKRLSPRKTVEEIQAQDFDLSAKIEEAMRLEAEVKELYEPEVLDGSDDSGAESSSGEDQAEMP
ncbi:uncharacterized protein [Nicotiana tomentosiformis]|uniref:uncharacterized protein n=1 Tax=Nicotiana tomentosiformis TaxID=4098 RepID=UPI00388C3C06